MAGSAAEVGVNHLSAGRDARGLLRKGLALRYVVEGGQIPQLRMGAKHNTSPGHGQGGKEPKEKKRAVFHDAWASITAEG